MTKYLSILLLAVAFVSCSSSEKERSTTPEISDQDVLSHITFLAADEMRGREAGTAEEAAAANYIADLFRSYGLDPAGEEGTYFQEFTINTAVLNNPHASESDTSGEKRLSKNVAGLLQGTGDSDEVIIVGAHYDHLGMGSFGSLSSSEEPRIHNGADDNASGTAGVLELAEYFSANRPETDLLFLAFSGEEMGLLGSQYYVENPTVELENALAMINMDMVGRMSNGRLMVFGVATTDSWESILTEANTDSLQLDLVPDGTGASDHTSFYYQDIPVLHYFTDTHADYHRPSDDTEWINAEGQEQLLTHVKRVIERLDELDKEDMAFTEAPGEQQRNMTMDGPTLGVLPDYGYDGEGFRITGVSEGRAADNAGLQGGDIIINIGGMDIADIYKYMEALNELKAGQQTTVTVLRDGEELSFDLQL
ncbi:M28 family peptidase [Gracilimonas sediminicola]|uniref:M28 family peptidase n=1 Tax=Gracilimonas sediminicola TaxID=2952158 RepID=A0A9X2RDX5_9BACT|nr:M28 family peptidase [Gracilimonas sediminicola]MCP9291520.1 M28 family peptidase [Gracilimonas sediminicola]